MKYLKSTIYLSFIMLFMACSQPNNSNKEAAKLQESTEKENSKELKLNGTERWEANPETTTGVKNMISMVNQFDGDSFKNLKIDLETEFQLIFKNCTMKGEAHDQLHNYLYPFIKLFKNLSSEDANAQKDALKKVEERLAIYNDYFE